MKVSKGGKRKGQARRTWDKVYLYENVIMKVSTRPSKCALIKKMLLENKLRKSLMGGTKNYDINLQSLLNY